MSLSTRAVTAMVDVIQKNSQTFRHTLYFDNFFTCYYLFANDQKIHVVKWKENAVVKIATNYMTHSPLCVRLCNIGMGGVDILDRLAITYCLTIKPKMSLFYREKMTHLPGILLPCCPQLTTAKSKCTSKGRSRPQGRCEVCI
ncbi:hypothetical protein T01_6265 [Trichinella spiralis]|uniref:PiggyBac transposable element-derived protein domain-containing protein n=1 Tax=Trichinella spiralis TaxID=6334 RepID=A0A0V1B8B7_TRISP|nr:hypothetical protein T01_6265 [Trichinella spiralis]